MIGWYVIILLVVWALMIGYVLITQNLAAGVWSVVPYCAGLFFTRDVIGLPYYHLLSSVFQSNLLAGVIVVISFALLWMVILFMMIWMWVFMICAVCMICELLEKIKGEPSNC